MLASKYKTDLILGHSSVVNVCFRQGDPRISSSEYLHSDDQFSNHPGSGVNLVSYILTWLAITQQLKECMFGNFRFFVTCDEPQLSCKSLKLVDETWQQADSQFYIEYLPPTTIRGAAIALSWCRYLKLTLTPEPWTSMHSVYFDGRHLQIYLANLKEILKV